MLFLDIPLPSTLTRKQTKFIILIDIRNCFNQLLFFYSQIILGNNMNG